MVYLPLTCVSGALSGTCCMAGSAAASSASNAAASSGTPAATASQPIVNKNKRFRKEKPWDNDEIDHWAIPKVTPDDPLDAPLEESSFATLFPKYREKYLREVWPLVTKTLKTYGIGCELNLVEGSMTVKTTRKTWDPSMILKARDLIKLLARSLPVLQAIKILEDGMYTDIIKIKNMVRNKERYVKRRQRLIGPNGVTLKAIELVTGCYVLVQGNTVSAMGSIHGLKAVRKIVTECMHNVHPIYNIKILMIKKELAQDPKLKNENWDRFLPHFQKKNVQRKKPKKSEIKQKEYTPFPPPQTPRKIDLQLESGEYFLSEEEKRNKVRAEKKALAAEKADAKQSEREKEFQPPTEESAQALTNTASEQEKEKKEKKSKKEKRKREEGESHAVSDEKESEKKKKKKSKEKDREASTAMDTSSSSTSSSSAFPASSSAAPSSSSSSSSSKRDKKRKRGEEQATVPESERRTALQSQHSAINSNGIDVEALKQKFKKQNKQQKDQEKDASAFVQRIQIEKEAKNKSKH